MKTTLFILCFLCATTALGQTAGVLSNQPAIIQIPDHPQHAAQHDLAPEQSLLDSDLYSYAKGERPLWEFGPISQPVPLGDLARAARKEHELAKKAEFIFEK